MQVSSLQIIVTGAASGLGRHFCKSLCQEGARVAAFDIDQKGLDNLLAEVGPASDQLRVYRVNVGKPQEVADAMAKAVKDFGWFNGLVNNAGIYRDGLLVKQMAGGIVKMPVAQWQNVIDVDLTGPFLMAREFAAQMIETKVKPGVIVNISSVTRSGNEGQSNYSAAKAGVVVDTRVWALELAEYGIRVAAIAPGFIRTPILEAMAPSVLENWVSRVPLKRLGEPSEIYAALKFVFECEFFNGKCLEIDGGLIV